MVERESILWGPFFCFFSVVWIQTGCNLWMIKWGLNSVLSHRLASYPLNRYGALCRRDISWGKKNKWLQPCLGIEYRGGGGCVRDIVRDGIFFILVLPSCSSCSSWCSSSLQLFPKGVLNSTSLYPIFFAQSSPLLTHISTPSSNRSRYFEEPLKFQLFGWWTNQNGPFPKKNKTNKK
jgi:hypothetical protein